MAARPDEYVGPIPDESDFRSLALSPQLNFRASSLEAPPPPPTFFPASDVLLPANEDELLFACICDLQSEKFCANVQGR